MNSMIVCSKEYNVDGAGTSGVYIHLFTAIWDEEAEHVIPC